MGKSNFERNLLEENNKLKNESAELLRKKRGIDNKVDAVYRSLREPLLLRKKEISDLLLDRAKKLNESAIFNYEDILIVLEKFINDIDPTSFYTIEQISIIEKIGKKSIVKDKKVAIIDTRIEKAMSEEQYDVYKNNGYALIMDDIYSFSDNTISFYSFHTFGNEPIKTDYEFDFGWFFPIKVFVAFLMEYRRKVNMDISREKMIELEEIFVKELKNLYEVKEAKVNIKDLTYGGR